MTPYPPSDSSTETEHPAKLVTDFGAILMLHEDGDQWTAPGIGPSGKRAYGGLMMTQALVAARRTAPVEHVTRSIHVQFLRAGDAGAPVSYEVEQVHSGRTYTSRRVLARQNGRLLVVATASFALATDGLEHGNVAHDADPETLAPTGPAGPAPGLPAGMFDIRIQDHGSGSEFVRDFWWRLTPDLPEDPFLHTCAALFVTDVYLLDAALMVHDLRNSDRRVRWASTDHAVWFHRPIRATSWNRLRSRCPTASAGRAVVEASLVDTRGIRTGTIVQEGIVEVRKPDEGLRRSTSLERPDLKELS